MTVAPAGLFLALYVVPVLCALALVRIRSERVARMLGRAATLLTAVACGALLVKQGRLGTSLYASVAFPSLHVTLRFVLDAHSAPFLGTTVLLLFAWLVGASVRHTSPRSLRDLLWLEATLLWLFTAGDLATLAVAFCAVLVPLHRIARDRAPTGERTLAWRPFALQHGLGMLALVLGCALLTFGSRTPAFGVGLGQLDLTGLPELQRTWLCGAMLVACLTRMAVVPFHGWLLAALEQGGSAGAALVLATHTGAYLLVRLLPSLPDPLRAALPWLAGLGFVSALYGALLALGQRDLRRMVGALLVSQSSLMLSDLARHPDASLRWLGATASTAGLALMVNALGARTGQFDMRELGTLARRVPVLAAAFLAFGVAGLWAALVRGPGLPALGWCVLLIHALVFLRAFSTTFLSPTTEGADLDGLVDLLPRERVVVGLLLALSTFSALATPNTNAEPRPFSLATRAERR